MRLELILGIVGLLGLILFVFGLRRLWRRRPFSGGIQGLLGLVLLAVAALGGAIALNLYTYQRLTHEAPAAELVFKEVSPQSFRVTLVPAGDRSQAFDLRGDEWQLDARILKWRGYALLLNLDTRYRLDRLSGRYHEIEQERAQPRTVYRLSEEPGLDLWKLANRYQRWVPWVDAIYGSATYLPMADGARYAVAVSASGLLARPANEAADDAVRRWR